MDMDKGSEPSCHGAIMPSCHGSWTGVMSHPQKTEREAVAHMRSKTARALQKIKIIFTLYNVYEMKLMQMLASPT